MAIARRAVLMILPAAVLAADTDRDVTALFESLASGLSEGNAELFVHALDPAMPGYQDLAANVRALVAQADVLAAIEFVTRKGDDTHQDLQLDWFLEITAKADPMKLVRRREMVKCRLEKQKKKWRVVALEPVKLFQPI